MENFQLGLFFNLIMLIYRKLESLTFWTNKSSALSL